MIKVFAAMGALFGMLSVALGAFGAHGLRDKVEPRMIEVWQTASQYNMSHALALLAAAWLLSKTQHVGAQVAGWAFMIGIFLFSGSLYAMVLTGIKKLGAITPLGGVAFIIGWIALMIAATKLP